MKNLTKSNTINFAVIMGVIGSVNGSIALLAPLMTPNVFAIVTVVLSAVNAGGAIYLRTVTTKPLVDK